MQNIEPTNNERFESHKFANLCYLVNMCTRSEKGKNAHITITEHRILQKWCEFVNLNEGLLDQIINYNQSKIEYEAALETIASNTNQEKQSIDNFVEINNELVKQKEKSNQALEIYNKYQKSNSKKLEPLLEEILERHRYDWDSTAVQLSDNQIKELFEIANTNLRIDPEESDLLGYIMRMNNLPNSVQESRNQANNLLRKYSTDKSLLLCLSEQDPQRGEIIEQLQTMGYKIGLLNVLVLPDLLDGSALDPNQKLSNEKNYRFDFIDYSIEAEKGFRPNMIIFDPSAIIDQVNEKGIEFTKNELRKVCMSFENLGKDVPVLVYGNSEYLNSFNDMSLNIKTLARSGTDIFDLDENHPGLSGIQVLQQYINNTYELKEETRAI